MVGDPLDILGFARPIFCEALAFSCSMLRYDKATVAASCMQTAPTFQISEFLGKLMTLNGPVGIDTFENMYGNRLTGMCDQYKDPPPPPPVREPKPGKAAKTVKRGLSRVCNPLDPTPEVYTAHPASAPFQIKPWHVAAGVGVVLVVGAVIILSDGTAIPFLPTVFGL